MSDRTQMSLAAVEAAGRDLLALHDGFMSGSSADDAASKRLFLAACFGAAACEKCPMPDAAPSAMLRAMLMAFSDPMDPRLDYLRANASEAAK